MNVKFACFEDSRKQLFQMALESERHIVTVAERETEAVRMLKASSSPFPLIADNTILNAESLRIFAMLQENPEARCRVRVIGLECDE